MGENSVDGFELPEGVTIKDTDFWDGFVAWFEGEYGYEPRPKDSREKQLFDCFVGGAYWQFKKETKREVVNCL